MISIVIPIYNYYVAPLVQKLHQLASEQQIPFEILLVDDASSPRFRKDNSELAQLPFVSYLQNDTNMGRSKLRNYLVSLAKYPLILMMDCDATVVDDLFIERYLNTYNSLKNVPRFVIDGGVGYRPTAPDDSIYKLRWWYGLNREFIPAITRNKNLYRSFVPFNIFFTKSLFNLIHFDESITAYGHEDTLLGYELKQYQIPYIHIDNPLYHDGLDTNADYLTKVETSIHTLVLLLNNERYKALFYDNNKLLKCYNRCKQWGIIPLIYVFFMINRKILKRYICKHPNLFWLDVYKLGFLTEAFRKAPVN